MNRFLFRPAQTWIGGRILQQIFSRFPFLIPGERLVETKALLAFHHPSPSYPTHILIVPKENFPTLLDLPSEDSAFVQDLFKAVKSLVLRFGLQQAQYRLIVNGGTAQDVDHLHFHLVSNQPSGGSQGAGG